MVLVPEYLNSKSEVGNLVESVTNSVNLPQPNETTLDSVILTTFNDFSNRARLSSLWPLPYGTSCCFTESASLIGSRFDFDRYGLVPRSSPRQADPIITAGTVTMKMAPCLVRLYEQMPELKYVIAMGACTITGGMPSTDLYSTVRGVDKLIPVDIHLPGCPPKPEAIIDAIIKLRKKVAREVYEHGDKLKQTRRYFILNHQFRIVPIIHTGKHDGQLFSKFTEFSIESNLGTSSKIVEESKSSISSKISSQEIEEV